MTDVDLEKRIAEMSDVELFRSREVLLNTRGLTFFGLDWLNNSVTAVRCTGCGLIQFFGEASGPGTVGSS